MDITRRSFIKSLAWKSAIAAAGIMFPGVTFGAWKELDQSSGGIEWKKTPCRFCGTGCGLLVGVSGDRAVAVKGDPNCTVNKGLCCVKGYHSVQILYGKDRLTKALVRKNGKMVEVSMKEALDLVAKKMQETIKSHGKDAVSMYGSGQWSITDGYAASKLFKGCIGTNNVEANARLCMASAVTGFLTSFGLDEPMGCYDDFDHADVFITWGNNMAEMHPVLFSRMLANRQSKKHVKIIDFATRTTRSSQAADKSIIFEPQTDLAVANAIAYEIIRNKWVNWNFVNKNVSFHKGKTNIGYGTQDHFKFKDKAETVNFRQYKEFLKDYTPEKVQKISGVSAEDIKYMAALYGDPDKKVMSLWTMGMNQHTRGTWINNLVYNIHLLTGKISSPGNSPFSLTGQPSACGTVREVGTLTHKLP
ncbi:MAG: molybdopterin-dependent oxidoreductase, partial [Deltaproteobacteria bacterium]|nr:molybdopterin-dependent oxidoreductase [Deltaproteobacteria bacterium]